MVKRSRPSFTAILKATNAECAKCHAKNNLEVNHRTPLSQGGTNDASNLEIRCKKCHDEYHGHLSKKLLR